MSLTAESMTFLRELVHRRSGIVLDDDKQYLIDSRLTPLVRENGLRSLDELVARVRADASSALVRRVVEAMTTNETLFFRDLHPFEALRSRLVPDMLQARAAERRLRIWCAAASTGQEPYSIAMTIREHFPQLASWRVEIVATDLNATVLERAREGKYRQLEVSRGLPAPLLDKYFECQGAEWQLRPVIRDMVTFHELNLLDPWTQIAEVDIVFMRNVLIYFDVETKRSVLGRLRRALNRDAFLVLGGAETTTNLEDGFLPIRVGNGIYYRLKRPKLAMHDVA